MTKPPAQRGPAPRTSEAEARFDRVRASIGAVLGPVVLLGLLITPMPGLSPEAQRLVAIAAMAVVLWISEAIPLAVTAVLAPSLAVVFEVAPAKQVFAPFAHPLIFLFIGGFILAEALSVHGFDRRAALWLLTRKFVRGAPGRALLVVAGTSFVFSMWINNTATTAMMCPIAIGLCASIRKLCPDDAEIQGRQRRFEEGMLITLAYAASIGGLCTPIGTAPNMIAIAELDRATGVHFDFLRWMSFAVPIGLVALVGLLLIARRRWPPALDHVEGLTSSVQRDLDALGPLSPAEARATGVFGLAIVGWLMPSLLRLGLGEDALATQWAQRSLPEGVVAVLAASLLFVIPASNRHPLARRRDGRKRDSAGELPNSDAEEHSQADAPRWDPLMDWARAGAIDWGTVLLLGGGLALGGLTVETGLAAAIGAQVDASLGDNGSQLLLLGTVTALVIYMTELVSNTATVNMLLPVVIPLAARSGADPVPIVLTATIAASFAFMLPVSTPPNAIVYGSGLIRLPTMVRIGARLDVLGLLFLVAVGAWFLPAMRFW